MKIKVSFELEVPDKYIVHSALGQVTNALPYAHVTKEMVKNYILDAIMSWGGQFHYNDWRRDEKKIKNLILEKLP